MSIPENIARRRFFTLGLLRLAGAILIAVGALILNDKIASLPHAMGFVVLITGVLFLLLIPQILYARWRTPPED